MFSQLGFPPSSNLSTDSDTEVHIIFVSFLSEVKSRNISQNLTSFNSICGCEMHVCAVQGYAQESWDTLRRKACSSSQQIGIVESGYNRIRLFFQRVLKDTECNLQNYGPSIPNQEILSKATFLCSTLRGNAKLSSSRVLSFVGGIEDIEGDDGRATVEANIGPNAPLRCANGNQG